MSTTNGHAPRVNARIAAPAVASHRKREDRSIGSAVAEMRRDYQIEEALRTLTANIEATPVTISVENGDARAQALADQIKKLWDETLPQMHEAISYGRAAFEKVFGYEQGCTVVSKLDGALPFEHTRMRLKDSGEYDGFEIEDKERKWIPVPVEKSWWLALDATAIEPHGRSRLGGAVWEAYRTRRETLKQRDIFIRRFVLGWIIGHAKPTIEDENGNVIDNHERILNSIDVMRSGGAMLFGDATKENGEWLEDIEVLPEPKSVAPLDEVIDGQDAEQIRAFGFSEKTITEGESVGSFAMVSQQTLLLKAVVYGILRQYATAFQKYVVDKVVALNWAQNAPKITVVYPTLTEQPDSLVLELVKGMFLSPQLSPLITSGAIDVLQLLESVGIPLAGDAAQRLVNGLQAAAAPGLEPQDGPAGQYSGIGRRQWQNNVKAINDVLAQLSARELTETRARVLLRSLGLPTEEAEELIADAADGQMSRTLANVRVPREVATERTVLAEALRELSRLKSELRQVVAAGARSGSVDELRVTSILEEMRRVNIAATFAARLVGMASPWKPSLAPKPKGAPTAQRLPVGVTGLNLRTLAIPGLGDDGDFWRFPWLESAAEFLSAKNIATEDEFKALASDAKRAVLSAPGVSDREILGRIRSALTESIREGETRQQFADRVDHAVALTEAQMETLFRTNTHQAYVEGQEQTLSNPAVAEEFPFVMFAATNDTRTRDEHAKLDGRVARRGSREHTEMLEALKDYNCRCVLIPMTAEDARNA